MHIKTSVDDGKVVDDTRLLGNEPFALRLGKSFILPALEDATRSMQMGEVCFGHARFAHCGKSLLNGRFNSHCCFSICISANQHSW